MCACQHVRACVQDRAGTAPRAAGVEAAPCSGAGRPGLGVLRAGCVRGRTAEPRGPDRRVLLPPPPLAHPLPACGAAEGAGDRTATRPREPGLFLGPPAGGAAATQRRWRRRGRGVPSAGAAPLGAEAGRGFGCSGPPGPGQQLLPGAGPGPSPLPVSASSRLLPSGTSGSGSGPSTAPRPLVRAQVCGGSAGSGSVSCTGCQ